MAGRRNPSANLKPLDRVNCSIRCTLRWSEWVFRGARHCRLSLSNMIEIAVIEYLKRRGFTEVSPERIPPPAWTTPTPSTDDLD